MRKQLFYLALAIVAIAASACRNGDYPTNIQGNWEYNDTIATVQSLLSTSSSSASKGIPATVDYIAGVIQYSTKVLIDYDPSDGYGSFRPEKGTEGLQGSIEAIDKLNIKVTLNYVDKHGTSTTLLKKAVYTYKKDTNNN